MERDLTNIKLAVTTENDGADHDGISNDDYGWPQVAIMKIFQFCFNEEGAMQLTRKVLVGVDESGMNLVSSRDPAANHEGTSGLALSRDCI